MDLWQAAQIGIRRWYLTLPAIAAGLALAFMVSSGVDPEYRSSASLYYKAPALKVQIIDADTQTEAPGDALAPATRAVAQTSAARLDRQARASAEELELDSDFIVSIPDGQVPHVTIDVLSPDPDLSVDTLDFVVKFAKSDILERQVNGDSRLLNDVEIVFQDQEAIKDLSSRSRMLIVLSLVTMIAAFALTVAADGFLENRGRKDGTPSDSPQPNATSTTKTSAAAGVTATQVAADHPTHENPQVPVTGGSNKTLAQELEELEAQSSTSTRKSK